MLPHHRLPLDFDAAGLSADLDRIGPEEWVAHFNKQDYDGDWHAVALRAVAGDAKRIAPGPGGEADFRDTPLLERCPAVRAVLAQFHCPLRSVRLLRLRAGAIIREHRDPNLGLDDGEARIHVPVATNPDVAFFVNGERVTMNPGECWYLNLSLPHRVANRGTTDRVHLVIDCVANDWLRGLLPVAPAAPPPAPDPPRCPEAMQRFRELVLADVVLQEELRDILDRQLFVTKVVQLGAAQGCAIAPADVEAAMNAGRRVWLERWVG